MTIDEEDFKKAHGLAWAKILNMRSFTAGMIHLNISMMEEIKHLSDDDITRNSVTILAGLRGRLLHEAALLSLPIMEEESTAQVTELQPEYVVAVDENFKEHQRQTGPKNKRV